MIVATWLRNKGVKHGFDSENTPFYCTKL